MRERAWSKHLLLAGLLLPWCATAASAQSPWIGIGPEGGSFTSPTLAVSINWCGGFPYTLLGDTRSISLNGADVTGAFSYEAAGDECFSSEGTLTLAPGENTLSASIVNSGGHEGFTSVTYTYHPADLPRAPIVSDAPHHSGWRDVSQGAANVSYSTPAYVSLDQPRALSFFYSSGQAQPKGFVQLDVADSSLTAKAAKYGLKLRSQNGSFVTFTNDTQELFFASGGANHTRIAAQFDAAGLTSGAPVYDAIVTGYWPDGTVKTGVKQVRILIVNERSNPLGSGWSIPGLQRLYNQGDGVFITQGDGSAVWFAGSTSYGYSAPEGDFSTVRWTGSGWTRSYPDGTVATFRSDGRLVSVADGFANQTSYGYDGSGRLVSVTDPAGKQITLGYAVSMLAWVRDAAGRQVSALGALNHLSGFQDPDGVTALDLVFSAEQLLGYWTRMAPRALGEAYRWHFDYDAAGQVAALTAPQVTTSDAGATRPGTRFTSQEAAVLPGPGQGSAGNPAPVRLSAEVRVATTDARGATTRLALDRFGQPTRIEEPLGRVSTILRNQHGQVRETLSPSGNRVSYSWSGPDLTQTYDYTRGSRIYYSWDGYGAARRLLRVSGDVPLARYFYTGLRLDSLRVGADSAQYTTRLTWDTRGRLLESKDSTGVKTVYRYDTGNVWMNTAYVEQGLNTMRRVTYTYDGYGRTASVTDPLGHVRRTRYDLLNRMVASIGPLQSSTVQDSTQYQYGARGLETVVDALGQRYTFNRNVLGWVEAEGDPTGRFLYYGYDPNGNLTSRKNRRGQTVRFEYDVLNRVTSRYAQVENETTSYAYDPLGRWMTAQNAASTDSVYFDEAGRKVRETSRGAMLTSSYNRRDQREQLSYAGNYTLRYGYDHRSQLTSLTGFDGGVTRVVTNAVGQPTSFTLPTGFGMGLSWSSVERASMIRYDDVEVDQRIGLGYSYDSRGLIDRRFNAAMDSARQFGYDAAGRLTSIVQQQVITQSNGGSLDCRAGQEMDPESGLPCVENWTEWVNLPTSVNYSYDVVGNRTDNGAQTEAGNRTRNFGGYVLDYDLDGNLTRKAKADGSFSQTLSWNSLDQLVRVSSPGQPDVSFAYDGWGRRVRKTSTLDHVYVWDGENLVYEGDGRWANEYSYYPGVDQPHSLRRNGDNGQIYYYTRDELGSVTGLVDAGHRVVNQYRYTPWGTAEAGTAEGIYNPLQFAAREWDAETGLYYNRARYYDPELGRFIAEDPIGLEGGINLYAYAENSPINATDPTGTCSKGTHGILVEVVSADGKRGYGVECVWDEPEGGAGGTEGQDSGNSGPIPRAGGGGGGGNGFTPTSTNPAPGVFLADHSDAMESPPLYADPVAWGTGVIAAKLAPGAGPISIRGGEIRFGNNFRIAPFGNRTAHPIGRFPHYHRRGVGPGQGIGRHRPWEQSWHDRSFWSKF